MIWVVLGAVALIFWSAGYICAAYRVTTRVNAQWFAQSERDHQKRMAEREFKRL